jgi:polyferredoxin
MVYQLLADLVLGLHFLFIVFAVAGGVLALRWRWMPWLHLPALAWGAAVEFTGWLCPLTPLENALRRAAGTATYTESFIEQYLLPLVYPGGLTREWQLALGGLLLAVNAAIYAAVWYRRRPGPTP